MGLDDLMHLADLLDPSHLLPRIAPPASRRELLERMTQAILESPRGRTQAPEAVKLTLPAVIQRDAEGSTPVEHGLALAHARVPGWHGLGISFATFSEPMTWSEDSPEPADTALLVINPADQPTLFLRALSKLLPVLGDPKARQGVLEATTPEALLERLGSLDIVFDHPLTAADIMRPVRFDVSLDCPVREVTQRMHHHLVEAVSVQDAEGRVVGEVTCDGLFRHGVPPFFSQLSSVAFMRQYDPFESYFEKESSLTAGEVMTSDYAWCPPHATLMEVVFLLSVKHHTKVYVLDEEGKRLGVIDRLEVIHRIFAL